MTKLLEIKITKATLFLYEDELIKSLPPAVYLEGIKRGKGILRFRKQKQREKDKLEGVNKCR